ncbi:MAG: hypothetical protein FK731_00240 [Asgard group archaeon]|nr:hypothetical protein [Asgard group archaeon]
MTNAIKQKIFLTLFFVLVVSSNSILLVKANSVDYSITFEEVALIEPQGVTIMSQIIDDVVIILDVNGYIRSYNISNPAEPELLDLVNNGGFPHFFHVKEDLLYLANHGQGVAIFNITNLSDISLLGEIYPEGDGEIDSLYCEGNLVYASEWHDSLEQHKIIVFNVTNSTLPEKISEYDDGDGGFFRFNIDQDVCYVSCLDRGFKILNVSDPLDISEISHFNDGGYSMDFRLISNKVFLADANSLEILDVSEPNNIEKLGEYNSSYPALDVEIDGEIAFISEWGFGFEVVVINNPSNIYKIEEFEIEGIADIEISNNYLFISMRESGFKIIKYEILTSTGNLTFTNIGLFFILFGIISLSTSIFWRYKSKLISKN